MRLLAIVSGDYGELGTAMYFLKGLPSTPSPMLMVPAPLVHTMPAMPGMDVRTYSNLGDITRVFEQIDPDTVLLTSGYLFAINAGLSLWDSARLMRMLRRRRVTLLTSDPFLGMLRGPGSLDFSDVVDAGRDGRSALAVGRRITLSLFIMRYLLRGAWHIYPAPIERLHQQQNERRLSYFNDRAQVTAEMIPPDPDPRPTWLFVISRVDYEMHLRAQGEEFVTRIIERLRDGVALGRRAMLIGPAQLVRTVRSRMAGELAVTAYSDTVYGVFMQHLMAAEYVFFWNYYSFSVIHRVLANRPAFFFHEGHMVHIMPALKQAGVRLFYNDWKPPMLDLGRALEEEALAALAVEITQQFRHIAGELRRCPSPLELLQLVAAPPDGARRASS